MCAIRSENAGSAWIVFCLSEKNQMCYYHRYYYRVVIIIIVVIPLFILGTR